MFCIISVKIKRLSETTAEFLEDNKAELTLVVSSGGPSAISLPQLEIVTTTTRAGNESPPRSYHNHGEGPDLGLLLVKNVQVSPFTLLRHYTKQMLTHSKKM